MVQKFKVGQKVRIVRALGERRGQGRNIFYYNGNTNEVQLGTKAEVISFDGGITLVVQTPKRQWTVHPDELSSSPNLIELLPGIEKLERHPVFEMAQEGIVFVVNDKLYGVSTGEVGENFYDSKKPIRRVRKPLVEIGSLDSLEELVSARSSEQLDKMRAKYLAQVKTELSFVELAKNEGSDIPQKIFSQVFPYLRGEQYGGKVLELLAVSKDEKKTTKVKTPEIKGLEKHLEQVADKFLGKVREYAAEIDLEESMEKDEPVEKTKKQKILDSIFSKSAIGDNYASTSLLGKALKGKNAAFISGKLYYLTSTNRSCKDSVVIDGKRYALNTGETSKEVEQTYLRLLSKEIRARALETGFPIEELLKELKDQAGGLEGIRGLADYSEGEFGFTKNSTNGKYFVWTKVPAFGIKNPENKKYYYFHETRVGFDITEGGSNLRLTGDYPKIVTDNLHPWAHGEGNFGGICLGDHRVNMGTLSGEDIATSLNSLRNLMFYAGIEPHTDRFFQYLLDDRRLSEKNHVTKTKQELTKMGVTIFE
ncbi:hypothetical protein KA107_02615 [Candidatus Pacearchaeota archaeon]|nr:hypothetical protein [Candidatus Pacearchaeota archaeon]